MFEFGGVSVIVDLECMVQVVTLVGIRDVIARMNRQDDQFFLHIW